ncbi:hypothetical protein FOZG_18494 [Fusarium oxysporum Fo47]|uniref:C2H2-type domain-containing protein n=1 Tax=Fusarium oxysporum Fo47 TaxID=660027 RepID=W9J6Z7_FUSOX|nr:hypothetical protein FOZG_18494 [Fusarium oxysporum Fo47]
MTASNLQSEPCSAIYPYVLLSTYRLLVCQVCGFASVADEVATHLRTRHRDIQPERRQELVEKIKQIPNILHSRDDLRHYLRYPTNTIEPIPYLAPPKPDGLKCRACGHIVRRVQKIQNHCAEKHQWINPRGRGRPAPNCPVSAYELPWEEHVACQRFFPSRAGSIWFQVNAQTQLPTDVREEEAYSDDEDEDTDSVFGYDEVDCENSEFADNQAEANGRPHANYPMMRDEPNMAMFIEFLELLYQLCLTISTEHFSEGRPSSTLLVFFSGILGFSKDCSQFLLARQFCPYLSGLIYIQRLILLERALPLREYRAIGDPTTPICTEHPLTEMTSLRDFGRNIARTEPPSLLFSWSDDRETIRYGDFQLSMDKFRQIPDYFSSLAEEICEKLMFDIKPDIDLVMMKDDMVNMSSGYSFVKHPADGLDKAYLDLLYSAYASRENKLSKDGR